MAARQARVVVLHHVGCAMDDLSRATRHLNTALQTDLAFNETELKAFVTAFQGLRLLYNLIWHLKWAVRRHRIPLEARQGIKPETALFLGQYDFGHHPDSPLPSSFWLPLEQLKAKVRDVTV